MNWEEIRNKYKNQWIVIEAVEAYSKNFKRILKDIDVLFIAGDESKAALKKYSELHKLNLQRELYVVHTSRERIDINEEKYVGVRPKRKDI